MEPEPLSDLDLFTCCRSLRLEVTATGSRLRQAWSSGRHRAELTVDLEAGA